MSTDVPAAGVAMLSDNTGRSADSRVQGYIPASDVVGVVVRRQS